MHLKPTQWYTPNQWGKPKFYLDLMHDIGRLRRRRVTQDGGESWVFYYRGEL